MDYSEDEAKLLIARNKMQKLEDAKIQVLAQNPALLGIGIPSDEDNQETIGTTPDGPNNQLAAPSSENTPPDMGSSDMGGEMPPDQSNTKEEPIGTTPNSVPLRKPSRAEIEKYDLEINNYASEEDYEPYDDNDY
jgi:hypothetical protein